LLVRGLKKLPLHTCNGQDLFVQYGNKLNRTV
jgi:hypothetical protein